MIIGLTGSIAMGKSEVVRILRQRGIPVFDADEAVHELYVNGEGAAALKNDFPEAVRGGRVDRQRLSEALMGNPQRLKRLEDIVHPLVRNMEGAFRAAMKKEEQAFAVLDIPLLLETGRENEVDAVVVVSAPRDLQAKRALARPGMTQEKLEWIRGRQWPDERKCAVADFVIDNSGDLEHLKKQVHLMLEHFEGTRPGNNHA